MVWHRDRWPTVTVQADVAPDTRAAIVVPDLTLKMAVPRRDCAEAECRAPVTAKGALSKRLGPDPLVAFSEICRADLDNVRRRGV
jgi:hypothetical protein